MMDHLQSKLQQQSNEPEKTMEVCHVCGALLVVGDVQQRIDEHLMGKQHAGYARIRAYVEDWKQVCMATIKHYYIITSILFL